MCFNGWMSGGFAAVGLFCSYWIWSKTSNKMLANAVFFFFTMEFLQFVQYFFLATGLTDPYCNDVINKVLTMLGFIHICCQPIFSLAISWALCQYPSSKNSAEHNLKLEKYHAQYTVLDRLCKIGGFLLFLRYPLSFIPSLNTMNISEKNPSTEWLRGDKLCTFKSESMVHLGWSIPMADPTYNIMSAGIHSFLMFAPFFAMYHKKGMVLQGIVLFTTGPLLAAAITSNLMEQASVWCFFSIAQIATMLFLIRETLLLNWKKDGTTDSYSIFNKGQKRDEAVAELEKANNNKSAAPTPSSSKNNNKSGKNQKALN